MRRDSIFPFILLFFGLTVLPAAAENRVALVVGNANYRNIPSLANPSGDAALMANTLKRLGFKIVGDDALINLDKTAFDNAVRSFGHQLQGADVGLFYYAGHGLQLRGANYLVPVGANPTREADVDFELEDVAIVLRQMEAAGTRLNLVMLDACRNNPFGGRGLRAIDAGLAQMRAPEGTLISFATQPGNIAQDGNDGHSPYSKALALAVQKPGIGVFDTLNQVGLAVKKSTGGEQQPWVSSSPIDGSFFFAGAAKTDEPAPVPLAVSNANNLQARPDQTLSPQQATTLVSFPSEESAAAKRPLKDSPKKQTAMVSPVQTAPSLDQQNDRNVSVYNGRWGAAISGSCPHTPTGVLTVNDGVIRGTVFGASGVGRISPDGRVSAQFQSLGIISGHVTGKMTSPTSGSGTWKDSLGCSGGWTMSR